MDALKRWFRPIENLNDCLKEKMLTNARQTKLSEYSRKRLQAGAFIDSVGILN